MSGTVTHAVRARRARVCARERARARVRRTALCCTATTSSPTPAKRRLIPSRSIPRLPGPSHPDRKRAAVGGDRRHSRRVSAAQPRRRKARARRGVRSGVRRGAGGRVHGIGGRAGARRGPMGPRRPLACPCHKSSPQSRGGAGSGRPARPVPYGRCGDARLRGLARVWRREARGRSRAISAAAAPGAKDAASEPSPGADVEGVSLVPVQMSSG